MAITRYRKLELLDKIILTYDHLLYNFVCTSTCLYFIEAVFCMMEYIMIIEQVLYNFFCTSTCLYIIDA